VARPAIATAAPTVTGALLALALCTVAARPVSATPISATLEGCVLVTDPRLSEAVWFAEGTFQAVAFDDVMAGCGTTVAHPVADAFRFDEDRIHNRLTAWLNLSNLPACGRRQYDLHYYLDAGVLDPFGLKSLVVDTGIDCEIGPVPTPPNGRVPEPPIVVLVMSGLAIVALRRRR
jgi:hypothetical protein